MFLIKKNKEVELTSQAGAVERNGIERWLDRYRREGERSEELARNFFSSFDAETLVSTGSFVEWNEDKELGVSGSALVVVSFPPWQSSFPPDAPYLFYSYLGAARLKCPRCLKYK